ncbi:MAG: L-serine ammonia-lyase, iron-sulfur-dependent, subunit alpha [Clostridiales bacterium]|nr:L-serine ammonia-lyase, iron-sulfur-dependent, subunit alpha [Clostridiales bacterium]
MSFTKLSDIVEMSDEQKVPFWQVILQEDMRERNVTKEDSMKMMQSMFEAMQQADQTYNPKLKSASGLAGGDGAKLEQFRMNENRLIGVFLAQVMEKAVKMGESNACMRRIVAMPTAGSCGVIPAVLLTYKEQKQVSDERIVEALYVAGGIGEVIATSASISGAEGGCQAEIGSASAMAAGAVAYLENGSNEEIIHAAAFALKNMLGLTCDPVAGLVEVPCIKRNISGAVNAVISAELAIAGVRSAIEPDEVIASMKRIGKLLPACLRETGQDGLAVTESAKKVEERMRQEWD